MEGKNQKKNFKFSLKKITKIYLPIILTIYIIFNIPFIPDPLGSNTNFNFQPASSSGEAYFFTENHFKNTNRNKKSNNNRSGDINITVWIIFLIVCIIIGFIYFIFNTDKNENEQDNQKAQEKADYIELLKDDSDYEGNI